MRLTILKKMCYNKNKLLIIHNSVDLIFKGKYYYTKYLIYMFIFFSSTNEIDKKYGWMNFAFDGF